jgi:GTP pyrophosphokinase
VDTLIAPLISALKENHASVNDAEVTRAYEVARDAHAGQLRKSGEAYITHPVAVAEILANLGLNPATIIAALLHDTVEDTQYSSTQLRHDFGDEIANLVDGVTKLDKLSYGPTAEAETVRKMVIAMSRDIRVLVIKLADRLHNARTWKYVSEESAARKARETLDIYAPLAHRLGMNAMKWELEDLSFEVLEPKKFEEISRLVAERSPSRDKLTEEVIASVKEDLLRDAIDATVTGRKKHFFSVYQKMVVRGRDFNDIYDLVGIRVLVNDVRDCYGVLGSIHARWSPVPGRFKDYIAMPKFNLYQSLHTTVIGPNGKAIEIQIRTYDMHARAEFGIAAHWKYKQGPENNDSSPEMLWLRQLHEWQKETEDPSEFLEALRFDLGTPEVFVFTPKGSVVALPGGSTPVDFAFSVHTDVGLRCAGAKVNGRLVPLESRLNNGDVVEIVTNKSENAGSIL